MLSTQQIEAFRQRLEAEKAQLLTRLKELEKPRDFGSDVEIEEEQEEAKEFSSQVAIAQVLKDRINEIDAAFNRMELGTFGLGANCHRELTAELLAAAPAASLCAECKKGA